MLLDGDRLLVSTGGYMFCLDPLTGESRWSNPLTGYGMPAPAALLSVRGQSSQLLAHVPDSDNSDDSVTTAAIAAGVIASTSGS